MDHGADKRYRVCRRKDIARLFEHGRRANDARITLIGVPNDRQAPRTRAGVAVSTRHGPAVRRNRAKRLCREAFRLIRHELPAGWDFMILPRVGAELTLESLQDSIRSLAKRLAANRGSPPR